MSLRQRIREWLGIQDLVDNQQMLYTGLDAANAKLTSLVNIHNKQRISIAAIESGVGRLVAKVDPKYAESEFSLERKAESDRITNENILRLKAEAAARAPYNLQDDIDG